MKEVIGSMNLPRCASASDFACSATKYMLNINGRLQFMQCEVNIGVYLALDAVYCNC